MKWEDLSTEQRRRLAEILAEERLPEINQGLKEIVPSTTLYARYIKRMIDIVISFVALVVTLPINLVIGIITIFDVGFPIFFRQQRIGKNEKIFTIIKFRNMRNDKDEKGDLLPASERVTKFGKIVRKTSLDELLNFWSILKGDMSLIGPRPLLPQYLVRFSKRHRGRFLVRPGLECPPRTLLNKAWTWQERFENDVWYVENLSFLVDCKMVINLVRYAIDPQMSNLRANANLGTFMGYDLHGEAITYEHIEQKYFDMFDETQTENNMAEERMKNFKGKKLLILGGKSLMVDMVVKAQKMGIYTIVTDNRPYEESPAKKIADKYYNISFAEIDKIVEMIKREGIDGVLTGYTDSYIEYYLKICEAAGLPCYGGKQQFRIATDKSAFKKACVDAGIPVIPGREVHSLQEAIKEAEKQGYPVILKPADNSGSRGVIKCLSRTELEASYVYAKSFSAIGVVILEKFMDSENIAVSYYAADGEIRLTTTCERKLHISKETGSSITSFTQYPSKYTDRYIKEVNDKVIYMLKKNKFENGMIAFQMFVDETSFYFCEMCFRPSGGHHYILIEDQNVIDEMSLLIEFAVNGSCYTSWNMNKETPYFKNICAMVKILGTEGAIIGKYEGIEKIQARDDVIKVIPMLNTGETVGADGTTAQILATIWYRCPAGSDPEKIAENIAKDLTIEDTEGRSIAKISIM